MYVHTCTKKMLLLTIHPAFHNLDTYFTFKIPLCLFLLFSLLLSLCVYSHIEVYLPKIFMYMYLYYIYALSETSSTTIFKGFLDYLLP